MMLNKTKIQYQMKLYNTTQLFFSRIINIISPQTLCIIRSINRYYNNQCTSSVLKINSKTAKKIEEKLFPNLQVIRKEIAIYKLPLCKKIVKIKLLCLVDDREDTEQDNKLQSLTSYGDLEELGLSIWDMYLYYKLPLLECPKLRSLIIECRRIGKIVIPANITKVYLAYSPCRITMILPLKIKTLKLSKCSPALFEYGSIDNLYILDVYGAMCARDNHLLERATLHISCIEIFSSEHKGNLSHIKHLRIDSLEHLEDYIVFSNLETLYYKIKSEKDKDKFDIIHPKIKVVFDSE